jgi:hypothetical protein
LKRIGIASILAAAACLAAASTSLAGHGLTLLDHPAPSFSQGVPDPTFRAGGAGASWELLATLPTGNPHTDLDFFSHKGDMYASVGTLAAGANGAGQNIIRLTQGSQIQPSYVAGHPSAECPSNPNSALSLQHDVEATPKGNTVLNVGNPHVVKKEAQLLVDASDQDGRCHDNGTLGLPGAGDVEGAPQGGLELIDIADPAQPKEIGLTSHIGEAHTVNVDPKRPHIAYAVTSDAVGVDANGNRLNEVPGGGDRFDLDGFEVVDMSSCMNFPAGTTIEQKRDRCRPEVYRYRYPSTNTALGHTLKSTVYACHELEVYPDDRLTCGSGAAAVAFDMQDAFDDNGTPGDFSDDKPRGTPLPCRLRGSSSAPPYHTGAMVMDCVNGIRPSGEPVTLDVPGWLAIGAPSIEGVRWLGSIHHQGRGAGGSATPAYDSTQDIDFNHELELSRSGKLLIATDERGGGVSPPGATCAPEVDNKAGNGGVHFYKVSGLHTDGPHEADEEFAAYARNHAGEKTIYRARIRTGPQASLCTAHVFQQMPGQNRIFMGWYSQGTQVVDFVERRNGTVSAREAGWFLPTNANTWVSAIFRYKANADGTFTYWGATGDFNLGESGRSAIDVYKVTLPAPPRPIRLSAYNAPEAGAARGTGPLPPLPLACALALARDVADHLRELLGRGEVDVLIFSRPFSM